MKVFNLAAGVKQKHADTVEKAFFKVCRYLKPDMDHMTVLREWYKIGGQYNGGGRFYHTFKHIAYMVNEIEAHKLPERQTMMLLMAAVYHDLYYNTADVVIYKRNEKFSARDAEKFMLRLTRDEEFIDTVEMAILATQKHKIDVSAHPHIARFLDLDMAILAAPADEYQKYAENVRKEFGHMSDQDFYMRRYTYFIVPLLKPKTIEDGRVFLTQEMHSRHDAQMRKNLRWEAAMIEKKLKLKPYTLTV